MKHKSALQSFFHRMSPIARSRGKVLRRLYDTLGLVYFGSVHQHDDELDTIRGFTASLTHKDLHYAVGTHNDYSLRIVDRFDVIKERGKLHHSQFWAIIEIDIHRNGLPHVVFVPTGSEAREYSKVFTGLSHLLPLNTLLTTTRSPEFHGRFQILARPTQLHKIEEIFTSPVIASIATRFWPHGIELEKGKLLVHLTNKHLSRKQLESTLASAFWLAEAIDEIPEH